MTPNQFLEHSRLQSGSNQFAVGAFERGITFYRQQIRALNLIYAMRTARDQNGHPFFGPRSKVLIIGGGAFGVTAATAASWVGFEVHLLERCQVLIPSQRGCDTRWLNPHFYDWPRPGADDPQAHLPLLDWTAGTAGQVAEQIEAGFDRFRREVRRRGIRFSVTLGAKDIAVESVGNGRKYLKARWRTAKGRRREERVRAVIYAVGFGIEHGEDLSRNQVNSYWRNDELSQIDMTASTPKKYLVSGVGDGGLTDVFRLKITNFRHERIFHEVFSGLHSDLIASLRSVAWKFDRYPSLQTRGGWLHDEFRRLEKERLTGPHFKTLFNALRGRLRRDTEVCLNGRSKNIRLCLNARKAAFKNALLTFILHRLGAFGYEQADLDRIGREIVLKKPSGKIELIEGDTKIIVRHGTNRRENLTRALGVRPSHIKVLERRAARPTGNSIYPVEWWGRNRYGSKVKQIGPKELLPHATAALGNMFVTTLADVLDETVRLKKEVHRGFHFRLTLHRLIDFNGAERFQQLTPYAGRVKDKEGDGRLFPIDSGTIGFSCRTGKPVVVRKNNRKDWEEAWKLMNFDALHARAIQPRVASILACPFFASPEADALGERVNLVLFADSSEKDFFDSEILHTIYATCKGFVTNLERMRETNGVIEVSEQYVGFQVQKDSTLERRLERLQKLGVEFNNNEFVQYKRDLTFKSLRSLNLALGDHRIPY